MTQDPVNHPAHYTQHPSGVECIELTENMTFNVGNAFKYLHRAALKGNQQQDLEKAAWYIEREIKRCPDGGFWLNIDWMFAKDEAELYFKHEPCPVRKNLHDFTKYGNTKYLQQAALKLSEMMELQQEKLTCNICGKVLTDNDEIVEHPETKEWCCADHWPQEEPH